MPTDECFSCICKCPGGSTKKGLPKQNNSQIWHSAVLFPRVLRLEPTHSGREVGLDDLQRSLTTQIILWFYTKPIQLQQCALRRPYSFSQWQSWMYPWGIPRQCWQPGCETSGSRKHWDPQPLHYLRCALTAQDMHICHSDSINFFQHSSDAALSRQ